MNQQRVLPVSRVISWVGAATAPPPSVLNDTATLMYDSAAPRPHSFPRVVNFLSAIRRSQITAGEPGPPPPPLHPHRDAGQLTGARSS